MWWETVTNDMMKTLSYHVCWWLNIEHKLKHNPMFYFYKIWSKWPSSENDVFRVWNAWCLKSWGFWKSRLQDGGRKYDFLQSRLQWPTGILRFVWGILEWRDADAGKSWKSLSLEKSEIWSTDQKQVWVLNFTKVDHGDLVFTYIFFHNNLVRWDAFYHEGLKSWSTPLACYWPFKYPVPSGVNVYRSRSWQPSLKQGDLEW